MSVLDQDRATIADVIDVLLYGADNTAARARRERGSRTVRTYASGRVEYDLTAREAYSYGRHFPLFRYIPRRFSGARSDLWLINGDIWRNGGGPSRTAEHQRYARELIAATGRPSLVVPFSAIDGAGILRDSLRLIHARPDSEWTETREVRTLAEVPRAERTVSYQVDRTAETLADIPERYRTTWRAASDTERAEIIADAVARLGAEDAARAGYSADADYLPGAHAQNRERLPDADGLYRWTETRTRDLAPDSDGLYRWTVNVHRLGDSLFSAVRELPAETRPADPFECERETARVTVTLLADGRSYCETAEDRRHVAGPSGACIHCGAELTAREVRRIRARYLSSFDTNENPPLYFLAQCPRGAGDTVETALDSLAPRAVHAAIARGRHVTRQGDIFFIDTELTREDLAARGAVFARLTQWTRDAAPRRGEVCYVAPYTAAERRRELRYARQVWRERFGDAVARAVRREGIRDARRAELRAESRELWRELRERHAAELTAGAAQLALSVGDSGEVGEVSDAGELLEPCDTCGAGLGAPCETDPLTLDRSNPRDAARYRRTDASGRCAAVSGGYRKTLAERHARELRELRDNTRRTAPDSHAAPTSERGIRRRTAKRRAELLARVRKCETALRSATLSAPSVATYPGERAERAKVSRYDWQGSALARERTAHVARIERARRELSGAVAEYRRELLAGARSTGRDNYRRLYGTNALAAWASARHTSATRYRPSTVPGAPEHTGRRERVRRAVSIYGTAHAATESATVRGAVYVRGTVRHAVDLEPTRRGEGPDHRPLVLSDGRWYLAVRNAVPRQTRRRRRTRRA